MTPEEQAEFDRMKEQLATANQTIADQKTTITSLTKRESTLTAENAKLTSDMVNYKDIQDENTQLKKEKADGEAAAAEAAKVTLEAKRKELSEKYGVDAEVIKDYTVEQIDSATAILEAKGVKAQKKEGEGAGGGEGEGSGSGDGDGEGGDSPPEFKTAQEAIAYGLKHGDKALVMKGKGE